MKEFKIVEGDEETLVRDPKTGYSLVLCHNPEGYDIPESDDFSRGVLFRAPGTLVGSSKYDSEEIGITTRDVSIYQADISQVPLDRGLQYLEVGAGLGGFIPFLYERLGGEIEKKPIVIDPANYPLMIKIMESSKDLASQMGLGDRLDEILARAQLMSDPSKVRLINKTLGVAVSEEPDILGSADVVVESWGPSLYSLSSFEDYETGKDTRSVKESLLRAGGLSLGC